MSFRLVSPNLLAIWSPPADAVAQSDEADRVDQSAWLFRAAYRLAQKRQVCTRREAAVYAPALVGELAAGSRPNPTDQVAGKDESRERRNGDIDHARRSPHFG
jgi:hypothetical protein